jgi:hypothetical protein
MRRYGVPDFGHCGAGQPSGARQLAARLIAAISAPYCVQGHQVVVSTNIGIAVSPGDDTDIACNAPSLYVITGGLVGINTTTPGAELGVNGTISATNFIGNGSGLTGVVAASGDRVVSSSTSMVAVSTTGYVSLTQSGVNTGWFNPSTGFVTIGVSSRGRSAAPMGISTATQASRGS